MVKYLLDTNVISALRRPKQNLEVAAFIAKTSINDCCIASLTVVEIARGIKALQKKDPAQAEILNRWFQDQVLVAFQRRVLAFDYKAALIMADFPVPEAAPFDDAIIAATAVANDAVLVTHNSKHFQPLGVQIINPWESSAPTS